MKNYLLTLFLVIGTVLHADLIDAKEAKTLSTVKSSKVNERIKNDKKIQRLISDTLKIINAQILKQAQDGHNDKVRVHLNKQNNNAILTRLRSQGEALDAKVREVVVEKIREKGYTVKIEELYTDIVLIISW